MINKNIIKFFTWFIIYEYKIYFNLLHLIYEHSFKVIIEFFKIGT